MKWLENVIPERHGQRAKRFPVRSLFFDLLLLLGVLLGVQVYTGAGEADREVLMRLLAVEGVPPSFWAGLCACGNAWLLPTLMVATAFLTGLSPVGTVTALLLPVGYGTVTGLTQAHLYAAGWGGVVLSMVIVLPRVLMMREALRRCCRKCQRMSCLLMAQLHPALAHCGGLQQEFKAYCLKFLSASVWVLASGIWDVLMRMWCSHWL